MPLWRVLLTDRAWPDFSIEREILAAVGAEIVEAPDSREETLVELARDCDAIGTCWARVTEAVIRAASRCKVIARFGIGLDNIAVATATELGVPVTYVPDYCVNEVADHTLALLLALARNVAFFHQRTKSGEYRLAAGLPMRRLSECTLGLVGLGRIGRAVYKRAFPFQLDVIAWNKSGVARGVDCPMVSFDELLKRSDIISLHAPLNESTRRLICRETLAQMKPGALLVNTSRGGLIDHEALHDAIRGGRLGGAALDVFDPEPPDLSHPLFRHERVIATPHAGFLSRESLVELRTRAAQQIADVLGNRRPKHIVNEAELQK